MGITNDDLRALIESARAEQHKPGVRALIRRLEAEVNDLAPDTELVSVAPEAVPSLRLCSPIEACRVLLPHLVQSDVGHILVGPLPYGYPTLLGLVRGAIEWHRLATEALQPAVDDKAAEGTDPAAEAGAPLRDVSASANAGQPEEIEV